MYEEFFGIEENPFSITPDPRYLYMSKGHQEALAHLLYGISENGGFVMLTGEVGTGKTSVCRCLLEQLPNATDVALILNPKLNELEFVASICDELGVAYPRDTTSLKVLVDVLNRHLLDIHAQGRHGVVIIDEAQNLSPDVLEQVRLLTNLETAKKKLLQMILIGQPELNDLLSRFEMRQLAQRVTARYHLEPLSRAEVQAYIDHRLAVGGLPSNLFTNWAREAIYRRSGGIPRVINSLSDRCLMAAYVKNQWTVDGATVREAAKEVFGRPRRRLIRPRSMLPWVAATAVLAAVFLSAPLGLGYGSSIERYKEGLGHLVTRLLAWPPKDEPTRVAAEDGGEAAPVFSMLRVPAERAAEPADGKDSTPPAAALSQPAASPRIADGRSLPDLTSASPVSLYEVFDAHRFANDAESAMSELFRLWGLDYARMDQSQSCADWSHQGIRCHRGNDTWPVVVGLDRPAVVVLKDSEGNSAYALLVGTNGGQIALRFGDVAVKTDRAALEPLWTGGYLMLWRAPDAFHRVMAHGLQGRDVAWLHNRLSAIDGEPPPPAQRATFDAALRARVIAFQRSRGLRPDGIVGPQTIIHLDNAAPGLSGSSS